MQEAVRKLQTFGAPPEGFEDDTFPGEDTIQIWDEWTEAVDSIKRPVTWEEAEILIRCCPTDHMAGVEWTLLHCIESVFQPDAVENFRNLIETCNSDMMKNLLLQRLQNYIRKRDEEPSA
ncbi:MAG: hypothetical protein HFF87_01585 [Oscillibacter sp.]|jgi:hypothetical protein|nr:hypothetical protein [Oscillibacter sp.]